MEVLDDAIHASTTASATNRGRRRDVRRGGRVRTIACPSPAATPSIVPAF
jgi:hypothetical protein